MLRSKRSWSDAPNGNYWDHDEDLSIRFQLGLVAMGDDGGDGAAGGSSGLSNNPTDAEMDAEIDAISAGFDKMASADPNDVTVQSADGSVENFDQYSSGAMREQAEYDANKAMQDAGYTTNKGVTSTGGKAVTDGFGNAVMSGSYKSAYDDAFNDSMSQQTTERNIAQFNEQQAKLAQQGKMMGQTTIDVAMGKGGYMPNFTANPTNHPVYGYDFNFQNPVVAQGPASLDQLAAYGNFLGSGAQTGSYAFPEATYYDPFGTAMAGRVSQIDGNALGSDVTTANEQNYFDNFSTGYNDSSGFFGTNIQEVGNGPAAGNVGFSTFGQRLGDTVGPALVGMVAGQMLGPVGSTLASGLDVTTQTPYANQVSNANNPYASSGTQYSSYDAANMLGGLVGSAAGKYAANEAAQAIYNSTGNVNNAVMGAIGVGGMTNIGAKDMVNSVIGSNLPAVGIGATELPSPVELQAEQQDGGGGGGGGSSAPAQTSFSQSVAGTGDAAPEAGGNIPQDNGMSETLANLGGTINDPGGSIYSDPVAATDPIADYLGEAITGQPAGVVNPSAGDQLFNPLLMADASTGVQYLTSGRNREYGSDTTSKISRNDFLRNDRRSRVTGGFGRRASSGVLFA